MKIHGHYVCVLIAKCQACESLRFSILTNQTLVYTGGIKSQFKDVINMDLQLHYHRQHFTLHSCYITDCLFLLQNTLQTKTVHGIKTT